MQKTDVIIPIYNSPEWLELCCNALFSLTDDNIIGKVILIDDCSNPQTKQLIASIAQSHNQVMTVTNSENLGFVKTVNKALTLVESEFVLLLNSDCLVAENTVKNLIDHMTQDDQLGVICPLSNNADNLSIHFPPLNYLQVDHMLNSKLSKEKSSACTAVGNCLLIRTELFEKVGVLDEIYGMGYGEETDFQFKCWINGYKSCVALNCYCYHKSGASFGTTEKQHIKRNRNSSIFYSRWAKEYARLKSYYMSNNPIHYVSGKISADDIKDNYKYNIPFYNTIEKKLLHLDNSLVTSMFSHRLNLLKAKVLPNKNKDANIAPNNDFILTTIKNKDYISYTNTDDNSQEQFDQISFVFKNLLENNYGVIFNGFFKLDNDFEPYFNNIFFILQELSLDRKSVV